MRKLFEKIWKKEEGFTLIELIIVIAILAIISAIAIPNVLSAVDNSRRTSDVTNARMIADAAATVKAMDDSFAGANGQFLINDAAANTYRDAILTQLNAVAPVPKYKGTAVDEDEFLLVINATTGKMTIYVIPTSFTVGDTITEGTNAVQVFPDTTTYEIQ